jgi:type IV pilus assembly protein PilF
MWIQMPMWSRVLQPALLSVPLLLSACGLQPLQSPNTAPASGRVAAQLELGLGYLSQEQLPQAREHLEKALLHATQAMEEWVQIHYALALIEMRGGREGRAEHHFQQALESGSGYPEAENGYGVLLCQQGRVAEAEHYFLRALNNPLYTTPEVAEKNRKVCGERQQ